jgi:hypothetical protein
LGIQQVARTSCPYTDLLVYRHTGITQKMHHYHIHLIPPTEERLINIKSRSPGLRFFLLLNLPNNIASGILNFISAYSSGGCIGFPPISLLLRTKSDTFNVTILFSISIKHEFVLFGKEKTPCQWESNIYSCVQSPQKKPKTSESF